MGSNRNIQIHKIYRQTRFLANAIEDSINRKNNGKYHKAADGEKETNKENNVKDTPLSLYPGHIPTSLLQKGI